MGWCILFVYVFIVGHPYCHRSFRRLPSLLSPAGCHCCHRPAVTAVTGLPSLPSPAGCHCCHRPAVTTVTVWPSPLSRASGCADPPTGRDSWSMKTGYTWCIRPSAGLAGLAVLTGFTTIPPPGEGGTAAGSENWLHFSILRGLEVLFPRNS